MRLLIISLFLAAAASLGMADGTPTSPSYPSSPFPPTDPSLVHDPQSTAKPHDPQSTAKPHDPQSTAKPLDPQSTAKPLDPQSTAKPHDPQSTAKPHDPQSTAKPQKETIHTDEPDPDEPDSSGLGSDTSSIQPLVDALSSTAKDPISELLSLSPECQATLFSIVAQPEFLTCVPVSAFLPLLPVLIDPNGLKKLLADPAKNLPPVLEPLFGALCSADKCSDQLIAQALKALGSGCKKDAKNPLIQMVTGVATFYSPIRDSICFKDKEKEFCVIETLKIVFTLPKPPIKITGTIIDSVAFAEPKSVCTPCNKAIINTFFNFIEADKNKCVEYLASIGVPQQLLTIGKLGVALKCGFQFVDGKVGTPEKTDPDDFEYQVSSSGASNVKGFSLMAMIGVLLVSALMI